MRNLEPVYIGWVIFAIQLLVLTLLSKCLGTDGGTIQKKIAEKKEEQKWFAWTVLIDVTYINIIQLSFLQIVNPSFKSFWSILSLVFSVSIFIIFSYYPYWLTRKLKNGNEKDENFS